MFLCNSFVNFLSVEVSRILETCRKTKRQTDSKILHKMTKEVRLGKETAELGGSKARQRDCRIRGGEGRLGKETAELGETMKTYEYISETKIETE